MVDRIVPAVTAADLSRVEAAIGMRDEGAIITSPFHQWVIEDRFVGPRPRWEVAGAQLVADVAPYEAVADPMIAATIDRLMRCEATASLAPVVGLDLEAYADALVARFRNTALPHRLSQTATDGSKKIPQRWLESLAVNAAGGRRCPKRFIGDHKVALRSHRQRIVQLSTRHGDRGARVTCRSVLTHTQDHAHPVR